MKLSKGLGYTQNITCFRNLIHFFAEEQFALSIDEIEYVFNDVLEQVKLREEYEEGRL